MRKLLLRYAFVSLMALAYSCTSEAQNTPESPTTNDSAYGALRLMSKTLGKDSLDRVVEVTGRDGVPQPTLWKIVLQDGDGGTNEVDVAGGKIVSQRTDAKASSTRSLIHLQDLNLDSSGAFDATDAQARKVRLRFDSVNYALRTSETTGKPQWTLSLFNQEGAEVGAMRLAAHDGNIVSIDGRLATGPAPSPTPRSPAVVSSGRSGESATASRTVDPTPSSVRPRETVPTVTRSTEYRTNTTVVATSPPSIPPYSPPITTTETVTVDDQPVDRGEGGLFTRTGRTIDKTNRTVEQTLRQTASRVQHFFTRPFVSDQDVPSSPPPAPRDPNYRGD